jgi:hypothetical protein
LLAVPASPELTGGAGFSFEDAVVATYLTSVLVGGGARGLPEHVAKRVFVQRAALGQPLDDVIVDGEDRFGRTAQLSLQVKQSLTVSDAETNRDFPDIVRRAWATFVARNFRRGHDRVGAATGRIAINVFRDVTTTCEWARASASGNDFYARLNIPGFASQGQRDFVATVTRIISSASGTDEQVGGVQREVQSSAGDVRSEETPEHGQSGSPPTPSIDPPSDEAIWEFLRHFVLLRFDLRQEGAEDDASSIERLRIALGTEATRAVDLWVRLLTIARELAGAAGSADRESLVATLAQSFRLDGSPRYARDLIRIADEVERALRDIRVDIAGYAISRSELLDQARALLTKHRLVHLTGAPGSGKSVLLRLLAERQRSEGFALVLKADRLVGPGWAAMATHLRLDADRLIDLLLELAVSSEPVLYIDGLDRVVDKAERMVLLDVVRTVLEHPALSSWRIVATLRDGNIEHVRTWLPEVLIQEDQVAFLTVPGFTDADAEELATANPSLRPVLFGAMEVREIARRPFFLDVLARSMRQYSPLTGISAGDGERATSGAQALEARVEEPIASEPSLISAWWRGGGYDAERDRARSRQSVLLALGKRGARCLGRRMRSEDLNASAIQDLIDDGVLREAAGGAHVAFRHDIFFEWAFYQVCSTTDTDPSLHSSTGAAGTASLEYPVWFGDIVAAGELPALGRVVELLSQAALEQGSAWEETLTHLEAREGTGARSQWTRAWLLAPFGAPCFDRLAEVVTTAVFARPRGRLDRLLVWFRAVRTIENPLVIAGESSGPKLDGLTRLRVADALAWPRDYSTWTRFLRWVLANSHGLSVESIADVLAVFDVWLNALDRLPNALTDAIRQTTYVWLVEVEEEQHPEHFAWNPKSKWRQLTLVSLDELELRLRTLFIRAASSRPDTLSAYLERVRTTPRLLNAAFKTLIAWSPRLALVSPVGLVDLTLAALVEALLSEKIAKTPSQFGWSTPHLDWHSPGIADHVGEYTPASPTREPFASLFTHAPSEALRLIRHLLSHAMSAWRELHHYDRDGRDTPLPLMLTFPWGAQTFWGDVRVYTWFRGNFAHGALASALMSLEDWAFSEIERKRDVDEVIRDVVQGSDCLATLGIAVTLALETMQVSATTLPLVTSQRLWHADVKRLVSVDSGGLRANEVGAHLFPDSALHLAALRRINGRRVRRLELRSLAGLFAVSSNNTLRDAFSAAVRRFPDELPFEYASEADNPRFVTELQQTAKLWAEFANRSNYALTPTPDGDGAYLTFENPQANAPHVKAAERAHAELNTRIAPFSWAVECLTQGRLTGAPLAQMVAKAQALDAPDLFERATGGFNESDSFMEWEQSGVVGVAASVLAFGSPVRSIPEDETDDRTDDGSAAEVRADRVDAAAREWAVTVVHRAARARIFQDGLHELEASGKDHPGAFAAFGLGAILGAPTPQDDLALARAALLGLVAHPNTDVAATALAQSLRRWGEDPALAWAALHLAVECSIDQRADSSMMDESYGAVMPPGYNPSVRAPVDDVDGSREEESELSAKMAADQNGSTTGPPPAFDDPREIALDQARQAVSAGILLSALPVIPDPWLALEGTQLGGDTFGAKQRPVAERGRRLSRHAGPTRFLRTDRIGRVLRAIPLDIVRVTSVDDSFGAEGGGSPRDGVLSLVDSLLLWTVSRCSPPAEGNGSVRGRPGRRDLPIDWIGDFMGWLALLGASLSADELRSRILAPIFSLSSEARAECLRWFTPLYAAAAVIDPPDVPDGVISLLGEIFDQVASDEPWESARRNPSRGLDGNLQVIVNALLAADWDDPAPAAARFANGDWSQVRLLQPLVRDILARAGDIPSVLGAYLKLVERSSEVYSVEDFLAEVGLLPGSTWESRALWMPNSNAARIAAVLQHLVERERPLTPTTSAEALRLLDHLVDVGDRRSAALQVSEMFAVVGAST